MITEKQQALIDKVMDCFDFRKVVSYMKRKKWDGWILMAAGTSPKRLN